MKTAYQLAMERLDKKSPGAKKVSDRQKKELAELDSKYAAKFAEREIALKGEIVRLTEAGEFEKIGALQEQLVHERKVIRAELEEKKEQSRLRVGQK